MGGVDPVTATLMGGLSVGQEVQKRKTQKDQIKSLQNQQNTMINERKNLLNQQLASRRAMLGAMGVSMDGSNQSGQQKIIDDGYDDINDINSEYNYKYKNLDNRYKEQSYSTAKSYSKTLI